MKRTIALPVLTVASAAVLLTGCSSSDHGSQAGHSDGMTMNSAGQAAGSAATGTPARGPHNDQDRLFASDMIPHHRQAVEMADMALTTSKDTKVRALATTIEKAQAPEIATMTGWLTGWNAPVPSGSMDHMDHEGMHMQGMMSEQDMTALSKATGTAFDRMWLTMMIEHHRGAVSMAKTELSQGQNGDAKALATTIISSQNAEIAQMTSLLDQL